jgi:hypothetical protein
MESITLDRGAAHLKDELMPRYAELIYNGFWFSPGARDAAGAIDKSQEHVEGTVRLKLYKGNVIVTGRPPQIALFGRAVTFEDDQGAYDQKRRAGFIKLNALGSGCGGASRSHGAEQRSVNTRLPPSVGPAILPPVRAWGRPAGTGRSGSFGGVARWPRPLPSRRRTTARFPLTSGPR